MENAITIVIWFAFFVADVEAGIVVPDGVFGSQEDAPVVLSLVLGVIVSIRT